MVRFEAAAGATMIAGAVAGGGATGLVILASGGHHDFSGFVL